MMSLWKQTRKKKPFLLELRLVSVFCTQAIKITSSLTEPEPFLLNIKKKNFKTSAFGQNIPTYCGVQLNQNLNGTIFSHQSDILVLGGGTNDNKIRYKKTFLSC